MAKGSTFLRGVGTLMLAGLIIGFGVKVTQVNAECIVVCDIDDGGGERDSGPSDYELCVAYYVKEERFELIDPFCGPLRNTGGDDTGGDDTGGDDTGGDDTGGDTGGDTSGDTSGDMGGDTGGEPDKEAVFDDCMSYYGTMMSESDATYVCTGLVNDNDFNGDGEFDGYEMCLIYEIDFGASLSQAQATCGGGGGDSDDAAVSAVQALCITPGSRIGFEDNKLLVFSDFSSTANGMLISEIPFSSLRAPSDEEKASGQPILVGSKASEFAQGWFVEVYWQNDRYGVVIYNNGGNSVYDVTGASCDL